MAMPTVPDWLTKRSGTLKQGIRENLVFVMVGDQPLYRLESRPAAGAFTCYVSPTVNGQRLDDGATYPTREEALTGGLEQLRNTLGW